MDWTPLIGGLVGGLLFSALVLWMLLREQEDGE